jgi:hypothetical protein
MTPERRQHTEGLVAERSGRHRMAGPAALLVVLVLFGGAITAVRSATTPEQGPTTMAGRDAPPIELTGLRPKIAAQYRHAETHADLYRSVPCYCGCDRFADHADLYDCYVRADGAGYDAHAAGCAICQAEAEQVRRLVEQGRTPAEIRRLIIDQFGPAEGHA